MNERRGKIRYEPKTTEEALFMQNVANNIYAARRRSGMTQKQVYERCGIQHTVLSDIENCKRRPLINHLYYLAKTFDIPVAEFFEVYDGEN